MNTFSIQITFVFYQSLKPVRKGQIYSCFSFKFSIENWKWMGMSINHFQIWLHTNLIVFVVIKVESDIRSRVRWVMNFLSWGYKISLLSEWMGIKDMTLLCELILNVKNNFVLIFLAKWTIFFDVLLALNFLKRMLHFCRPTPCQLKKYSNFLLSLYFFFKSS